jgi:hypothetical protein
VCVQVRREGYLKQRVASADGAVSTATGNSIAYSV